MHNFSLPQSLLKPDKESISLVKKKSPRGLVRLQQKHSKMHINPNGVILFKTNRSKQAATVKKVGQPQQKHQYSPKFMRMKCNPPTKNNKLPS